MLNRTILGTTLTLLFAASGADAQDTPAPHPAAPQLRLRTPGTGQMKLRLREQGPRLGVTIESTPDGLKVTTIDEGSLAAAAGVQVGDVLLRIGDQRIHEVEDVALALHAYAPGSEVEVTVIRPGSGLATLKAPLPEPPPVEPRMAADGNKGGFLGVQMKQDAPDGGVTVGGIVPDSAAWFAGLEEGDVLLALDGKPLAAPEDLAGVVAGKEPGAMIEMKFRRGAEEQTARVRLGRRAPAGPFGAFGTPGAATGPRGPRFRMGPDGAWLQPGPGMDDAQPFPFEDFHELFGDDFGGAFRVMPPDMLTPDRQGPDMQGLGDVFKDLHGALDGGSSVQVHIDNDHMTITKDGVVQEFERGADGQWTRLEDKTPADATPHGA